MVGGSTMQKLTAIPLRVMSPFSLFPYFFIFTNSIWDLTLFFSFSPLVFPSFCLLLSQALSISYITFIHTLILLLLL